MSDLILVLCETCGGAGTDTVVGTDHEIHCTECEGVGWVLVEGAPINLEDLERMAPWADVPLSRPLESGELTAYQGKYGWMGDIGGNPFGPFDR